MEERYGEIYYVTDDERTSIERGLTAIFWVSESPARHLELRQRGARLGDAPASGSPSSGCGRGDRLNALTLRRCRWIARTMAESSTITTLRTKRDQIEGLIAHLEDRIKEARTDLAHVNATLRLFEMDGGARESVRAYMNLNRVSPRGEVAGKRWNAPGGLRVAKWGWFAHLGRLRWGSLTQPIWPCEAGFPGARGRRVW